ncbi:MAG: tRNA preQ1(34) S-adenosylmethionine ribosyltransferase-isomerase QueA [Beijerinckiaceae bacterium]
MRVDLFDFELPEERIALRPAEPRDAARMLVVDPAGSTPLQDRVVRDLPGFLRAGDVLVVNDTKVIPARLRGLRDRQGNVARIEVTLHKREDAQSWRAFAKPAKRLRAGDRIRFGDGAESYACELGHLDAEVIEREDGGQALLRFSFTGAALDEAIERIGEMPLPPYIASRRAADSHDAGDYQTLFARQSGAVAAPTASLHFTPDLIAALEARGVDIVRVTLHVGAGTFLPVKAGDTTEHVMHSEYGIVTADAAERINRARAEGGRIVAAGTTSLRILETAAQDDGSVAPVARDTAIFITPGYRFRAVDILLTNFHLPRSTLFMLVSAFCGLEAMQGAYAHAIESKYRFYSYGDACLLFRRDATSQA